MEVIFSMTYLDNCKRYWRRRRRKYQRLINIDQTINNRRSSKKMRIARLGRGFRLRLAPKLIIIPPTIIRQYLTKFYGAYIDPMIASLVGRKRLKSSSKNQMVCGTNNEVVDARWVLEIYNRIVASRELAA